MTENQSAAPERRSWPAHWPKRSVDRELEPIAKPIEPHPEHGDLPPCESGVDVGVPCPRDAAAQYGYGYYCGPHLAVIEAGEDTDEAAHAVHWAKRLLWMAHQQGVEVVQYHLGQALGECQEDLQRAKEKLQEARRAADDPTELQA